MPIEDVIDANVQLAPAVIPEPAFGTSCLLTLLTSRQYANFIALSGGTDTLKIGANERGATMKALEILDGSRAYQQIDDHFTGFNTSDELILSYRGRATQTHNQQVVVGEDEPGTGFASVGNHRITATGGPYNFNSPGVVQVITATVEDAGGGNAETGTYTVTDAEGNSISYVSGTKQTREITIVNAAAQEYSIDLQGVKYKYTASGSDDQEAIRDGLLTDMVSVTAHPPHPDWIAVQTSTDKITIQTQEFGVDVTAANPLPLVDLTEVETPEAPETIATVVAALQAAIVSESPVTYTTADASPNLVATANLPGNPTGFSVAGRTGAAVTMAVTTDHRQTVTVVRDGLNGQVTAGNHPDFTNATSGTNAIDLLGVTAGAFVPVTVEGPKSSSLSLLETQSILELAIAQTKRITIVPNTASGPTDAYLGSYTATLFGVTIPVTAVTGDSIDDVRDALKLGIDNNLGTTVTTALVGPGVFDVTNQTAGQPFGIALTSPNSNQAATATVTVANYGIGPDIDRAFLSSDEWYYLLNGFDDALSIVEGGRAVEALVPGRSHVAQSSDNEIRDIPLSAATDVGALLVAEAFERTALIYHPLETGAKPYKAPYSQWVSDYATLLPGQVNPGRRKLRGFQFRKYSTQEASNLKEKFAGFLEQFKGIELQGLLGGKASNGRLFDLYRGVDQTVAFIQVAIADLMYNQNVLPYTPDGQNQVASTITKQVTRLQSQGFAIENSLTISFPPLSTAPAQDQQDGVMPPFSFSFRAQAGTNTVIVNGIISQVAQGATIETAAAA